MCSPHFLNLLVGLLKQLLVHQLGLTEKSTQEDWPHFPRCRTASLGVQADSGTQNPENIKACHPVEAQMPFRTGTGDISTCYSPRTSTESSAPRDSVVLAFQESQASDILIMDHMIMTPEMPPSEPEGGLDGEWVGDGEGSRGQGDRGGLDTSPGLAVPPLLPLASGHHVPTVTTWNREGSPSGNQKQG